MSLRRFVAVQLNRVEAGRFDDLADLARRVVHEHADFRHERGKFVGNLACDLRFDKPTTFPKEIEAERIGARVARRVRVVEIRDATDLDAKHFFIIRNAASTGLACQQIVVGQFKTGG